MTHFAPGAAKGSTFTIALAGFVVRALTRTVTALKNRHQVASLSQLDDRALKDIGLLRTDVQAALAVPLHCDPSHHLMSVAGDKRQVSRPESDLPVHGMGMLRRKNAPVSDLTLKQLAH